MPLSRTASRLIAVLLSLGMLSSTLPSTLAATDASFRLSELDGFYFGVSTEYIPPIMLECPTSAWIVRGGKKSCINFEHGAKDASDSSEDAKKRGYRYPTSGQAFTDFIALFDKTPCADTDFGKKNKVNDQVDNQIEIYDGYAYGACFTPKAGIDHTFAATLVENDDGVKQVYILVGGAGTKPTQQKNTIFSDVADTHANAKAIAWLKENKVFTGYADGTFKPDNTITRAELIKVLVATLDATLPIPTSRCFWDVETSAWYAPSVCYAKAMNWVLGYPPAPTAAPFYTFHPDEAVSKAEALKMIANVRGMSVGSSGSGAWYEPYMQAFGSAHLLNDTKMADTAYTRGDVAETLFRIIAISQMNSVVFSKQLYADMQQQKLLKKQPMPLPVVMGSYTIESLHFEVPINATPTEFNQAYQKAIEQHDGMGMSENPGVCDDGMACL